MSLPTRNWEYQVYTDAKVTWDVVVAMMMFIMLSSLLVKDLRENILKNWQVEESKFT